MSVSWARTAFQSFTASGWSGATPSCTVLPAGTDIGKALVALALKISSGCTELASYWSSRGSQPPTVAPAPDLLVSDTWTGETASGGTERSSGSVAGAPKASRTGTWRTLGGDVVP